MCTRLCCFIIIEQKQQVIMSDCTSRDISTGPKCCQIVMPWVDCEFRNQLDMKTKQFAMRINRLDPSKNQYMVGPGMFSLEDPWEDWEMWYGTSHLPGIMPNQIIQEQIILDQDDYMVVINKDGIKRNIQGPAAYRPEIGERWEQKKNTVQVPLNCYMIVMDSNNKDQPVQHIRGPCKFFPDPFQTIVKNTEVNPNTNFFPCVEVTTTRAVHISRANAKVEMLDVPQFYMPAVGERVLKTVEKTVMLMTDFCILKGADGKIAVMNGREEKQRAFFLAPFYEFIEFNCEIKKKLLSTLPTFMSHKFIIRTADNVQLELDVRISYQIQDVPKFAQNPIDFYPLLKNHIQNSMLDEFAKNSLREFMGKFADIAKDGVEKCTEYFESYGIKVLDIQVLNYMCVSVTTQQLLETDIHTNVHKQNELRARQNDVLIQEQQSEVQRKQKDLEVKMAEKDNEVSLKRKQLEIDIRLKEMDIEIQEEHKRKELLQVKRENDLVEADFEGRAKGQLFHEFAKNIDANLSNEQKLHIWSKEIELEQARLLYQKVNDVIMYPPNTDLKMYNFADSLGNSNSRAAKDGVIFQAGAGFKPQPTLGNK